jgi:uncharacterized membrane protein
MKKLVSFIKDRIITGIVIIVPMAVIVIIMSDTIKKLITLTGPITDNIAIGGTLVKGIIAGILLIILLGLIFFISGFLLKTYLGNRFKNWLERTILENIPFFNTINHVIQQITGMEKGNYAAVEISLFGNENKLLGVHTDTLPDGRFVVYVPFSPIVNVGHVYLVSRENVIILDIKLKDFMDIISKIGFESSKIYKKESDT